MISSPNTTFDESFVARLINEGASLIEARKYEMAIAMLHKALSAQKGGMRRSAAVAARKATQQHHSVQNRRNHENHVSAEPQRQSSQMDGIQGCSSSSQMTPFNFLNLVPSSTFVYKRPIYAPEPTYISKNIHGTMSIAIVFNLALAHHMAGLETSGISSNSIVLLTKSLRLYTLAQQLVLKQNQESGRDTTMADQGETTSNPELFNIVHLLGASNNIAQVHKALGHHEVANRHFQQLLSSVVYLIHGKINKKEDLSETTILRPLMEALFQSASHLVLKKYAADAA